MKTLWGAVMLVFINIPAISQSFPVLPVRFSQYANAYHRINPSLIDYDNSTSLFSGIQTNNIAFNTIYTYYTNFQFVLNRSSTVGQAIGLNLTGDHEGELLRRTGVYLLYAVEVPLNEKLRLGSGVSLGIQNFLIKSTAVSGGGSDIQPDGSIGISIRDDYWHLGISLDQMFNSELQPIEQKSHLARHINITVDKVFELSPFFKMKPSIWVRWYDEDLRDINLSIESILSDKVRAAAVINHQKELAFIFGLDGLDLRQGQLGFSFSYGLMTGKKYLSSKQNYELTLKYCFKRKDDRQVTFQ